jgi:L-threonylcarbamoyladenylate synthase
MTRIVTASTDSVNEAAGVLKSGGLVAMPTETVYGLAANALDGAAVARIFAAKGRPAFNPLITHVLSAEQAAQYVVLDERAQILIHHFWPGPLTLILPRRAGCKISELVGAGLPSLAVRSPAHKVARQLLELSGLPLAAPSANRSGSLSPTTPAHVAESLGDAVDMILAAGACTVGVESTVLDLTENVPLILRPGSITADDLEQVLNVKVESDFTPTETPKSPGQLLKHYAPSIPLRLNAIDLETGEALLAFGSDKFMGIRGGGAAKDLPETMRRNLSESTDLHEAAANLFAMLKDLDRPQHKGIAVMAIPEKGLGIAINDRLRRAAG